MRNRFPTRTARKADGKSITSGSKTRTRWASSRNKRSAADKPQMRRGAVPNGRPGDFFSKRKHQCRRRAEIRQREVQEIAMVVLRLYAKSFAGSTVCMNGIRVACKLMHKLFGRSTKKQHQSQKAGKGFGEERMFHMRMVAKVFQARSANLSGPETVFVFATIKHFAFRAAAVFRLPLAPLSRRRTFFLFAFHSPKTTHGLRKRTL